jgi:hypothetical protein
MYGDKHLELRTMKKAMLGPPIRGREDPVQASDQESIAVPIGRSRRWSLKLRQGDTEKEIMTCSYLWITPPAARKAIVSVWARGYPRVRQLSMLRGVAFATVSALLMSTAACGMGEPWPKAYIIAESGHYTLRVACNRGTLGLVSVSPMSDVDTEYWIATPSDRDSNGLPEVTLFAPVVPGYVVRSNIPADVSGVVVWYGPDPTASDPDSSDTVVSGVLSFEVGALPDGSVLWAGGKESAQAFRDYEVERFGCQEDR